MTSTTSAPVTTSRKTTIAARVGLVLAGLLAIGDLFNGYSQWSEDAGDAFAYVSLAFGIATLVLIPFAWRGSSRAGWAVAILRVVSSLIGLPVFFIPGIPAPVIITVAVGIVLAVVSAVLILVRKRA
ncbi:hypothetical protein BH11ACT3_BH11ACT3_18940 [soil metagenome]